MNKYLLITGACYALSTPVGVHIGYLMGQNNWPQVFAELIFLMCIQMIAPVMWVKAQTAEIEKEMKKE